MTTKKLNRFRDTAILATGTLLCVALAAYFLFAASEAIATGLLQGRRHVVVTMAGEPPAFWIGITWRVLCGMTFAFFAARIALIGFRIYKKGTLFVAADRDISRNRAARADIAPLIDETTVATIDR